MYHHYCCFSSFKIKARTLSGIENAFVNHPVSRKMARVMAFDELKNVLSLYMLKLRQLNVDRTHLYSSVLKMA